MSKKRLTGGRPSFCTPETMEEITKNLELAMPFKYASEAAGVPWPTMEGWIRRGKSAHEEGSTDAKDAPYIEAFHAFTRGRARANQKLHERVLAGGKGSLGAQFLLERQFRDEYGPRQRIEHAGHDGGAVKIATTVTEMSDDELKKIAGVG